MAFKGASESEAAQRQVKRAADEGIKPAPWAVVGFRVGVDNQGRRRVFRRVWSYREKRLAESRYYGPAGGSQYRALVENGERISECGDSALVGEWLRTRRGVNKIARPFLAATYMHRESCGRAVTYCEEGRDLRHLANKRILGEGER